MNSHLLECDLLHHRFSPRVHRFANRVFFLAVDLDELEPLARRLRLFSRHRPNLYALRDADYLPSADHLDRPGSTGSSRPSLRDRAHAFARKHGVTIDPQVRVMLVTIPRIAGYHFNPVSFYFLFRGAEPLCAIAEVTNTFREVKPYFLAPDTIRPNGSFRLRIPKHFYVSPFTDSGGEFDFTLRLRDGRLAVRIDEYEGGQRVLHSVLTGRPRPFTDRMLAWFAVKYPLLSLQVMARIHTQALRLYWKRIPWYRKSDQSDLQRGFHPPRSAAPKLLPRQGLT